MPERNPFRPFEQAMEMEQHNDVMRDESKKTFNESKAELERQAKHHPAPDDPARSSLTKLDEEAE